MNARHSLLLFFAVALLSASTARADVIPPAQEECDGESIGAACTDPAGIGVCQMGQCGHIDYQHWDRDASISPPVAYYDCVLCMVPGASDGGPTSDGGRVVDAGHTDMSTPPAGCSASGAGIGGGFLPLLLAAIGLVARRRP